MSTTDLATVNLNPADLHGQMELAKVLGMSALLPQQLRGKPADVLVTVMYGREVGLTPMQSIQGIYVVNGRPTLGGKLLLAKVRQAGHRVRVVADTKAARVTITRNDDPENPHTEEFTWADAERAKLTTKDTWKSWPKQMLTWRAVSNGVNVTCPEVTMGFEITELVQDELSAAQPPAPTLAQVAAERPTSAAPPATAPTPARQQEPVDADIVDDDEIRAAVEALHAQACACSASTAATAPTEDDGWPTTATIPGTEADQ
jgi:hypothetical protein